MRRLIAIVALVLGVFASGLPAAAQQDTGQQGGLAPSAAVKRAVEANPGAMPLGVKLRDGIYVVRLKQDDTIIQVGVDPVTGDVFPLN
jgi:hypothetical protein